MAGLRDELELDVTAAHRSIDAVAAHLDSAAKSFRVELAHAVDVLRTADAVVDVTADTRQVTSSIDGAVDAADSSVVVTGEARDVTGSIDAAVDAADTTVDLDVDTASTKQLRAELDKVNRELTEARTLLDRMEGDLEQVRRKGGQVEGSFEGVRRAAGAALSAFGARAVIQEIDAMITAASDLAESQSKVDVVFGESKATINEWAEGSAEALGLAKQEALGAAGTFGNLFTALGLSKAAAADLAPEVVQLGADFASFNNLDVPETLDKLRSGLVGEIEPLRALGVSFGAVDVERKAMQLGLADLNGEVSEGAKVQARWALILEQSTAAQGDFARTSEGLANQQRIMRAEFANARAEIGERLLPLMLDVVQKGRGFLDFFLALPVPVQNAALGFVALALSLGPIIAVSGNVTKAVTSISSAVTALATTTAASTIALGTFTVALIGIGTAFYAYTRIVQAFQDVQDEFDSRTATAVNNLALLGGQAETTGAQLRDAAVDAFLAGEGMAATAEGTEAAGDAVAAATANATTLLDEFSEASGVTRERIVQLANEMRVNLGTATDEQKAKLAEAVAGIGAAVRPTDRLAAASEVLGNEFSTVAEEVKAFDEALDAALGVYLSAEAATIRVRQELTDLAEGYKAGRQEGESYQQFQDRLALGTIDLARSVEDEVAALTRAGEVSTDVAAQKEALTSRLLALADSIGGPLADKLREYAFRVGAVPDEKVVVIEADTGPALAALDGLAEVARTEGEDVARQFAAGVVNQFRNEEGAVTASADRIAGAIDRAARQRLGIRSPSTAGMVIGGFFVEGLVLGIEAEERRAWTAAEAVAGGVADEFWQAAQITQAESLNILQAVASVADAEERLAEVRADREAQAIDVRIAELELAEAQAEVNRRTMDAIDAADEVTAALERQRAERDRLNDSLDVTLSALDAVDGIRSARRALDRANREVEEARARQAAIPGELAAAEAALAAARAESAKVTASESLAIVRARQAVQKSEENLSDARTAQVPDLVAIEVAALELTVAQENLAKAQADAVAPTRAVDEAERALAKLREEAAEIADRVRDATEAQTSAALDLVQAERSLIETGAELQATGPGWQEFFRSIAEAAGLTRDEIDQLVATIEQATRVAQNATNRQAGGRLVNTVTGRPAFTGPNGEGGSGAPRGVPGEVSWTMPDGTRVWYVPGQNIDPGNLGALGRAGSGASAAASSAAAAAILPNVNSAAGTVAGSGVTFTPGADPALVASIIAGLGAQFGAKSVTLAAGDLIVKQPSDADYLLRQAEFAATAGRFG